MKGDFKSAKTLTVQILIVIVLFSLVLLGLWRVNLIKFPDFIENLIHSDAGITDKYAGDGYEIFEHLSDAKSSDSVKNYPELSIDNLSEMLSSLEPYENFYWESISEVFSSTGKSSKECKLRVSGNKYNLELLDENGNTVKKIICDGNKTVVTDMLSYNESKTVYNQGLTDYFSDASIISLDYFRQNNFTDENCEIHLIEKEAFNLVSLVHSYERSGVSVKNNYMISLDYGVVLFAECYENDVMTYRLFTNSVYPLSSLEDELFNID